MVNIKHPYKPIIVEPPKLEKKPEEPKPGLTPTSPVKPGTPVRDPETGKTVPRPSTTPSRQRSTPIRSVVPEVVTKTQEQIHSQPKKEVEDTPKTTSKPAPIQTIDISRDQRRQSQIQERMRESQRIEDELKILFPGTPRSEIYLDEAPSISETGEVSFAFRTGPTKKQVREQNILFIDKEGSMVGEQKVLVGEGKPGTFRPMTLTDRTTKLVAGVFGERLSDAEAQRDTERTGLYKLGERVTEFGKKADKSIYGFYDKMGVTGLDPKGKWYQRGTLFTLGEITEVVAGDTLKDPVSSLALAGAGGVTGKVVKTTSKLMSSPIKKVVEKIPGSKPVLRGIGIGGRTGLIGGVGLLSTQEIMSSEEPYLTSGRIIRDMSLFGAGYTAVKPSSIQGLKFPSISNIGKKGAVFRGGKRISAISKSQMRQQSMRQYYDPRKTYDVKEKKIVIRDTPPKLKGIGVKERVSKVGFTPRGEITLDIKFKPMRQDLFKIGPDKTLPPRKAFRDPQGGSQALKPIRDISKRLQQQLIVDRGGRTSIVIQDTASKQQSLSILNIGKRKPRIQRQPTLINTNRITPTGKPLIQREADRSILLFDKPLSQPERVVSGFRPGMRERLIGRAREKANLIRRQRVLEELPKADSYMLVKDLRSKLVTPAPRPTFKKKIESNTIFQTAPENTRPLSDKLIDLSGRKKKLKRIAPRPTFKKKTRPLSDKLIDLSGRKKKLKRILIIDENIAPTTDVRDVLRIGITTSPALLTGTASKQDAISRLDVRQDLKIGSVAITKSLVDTSIKSDTIVSSKTGTASKQDAISRLDVRQDLKIGSVAITKSLVDTSIKSDTIVSSKTDSALKSNQAVKSVYSQLLRQKTITSPFVDMKVPSSSVPSEHSTLVRITPDAPFTPRKPPFRPRRPVPERRLRPRPPRVPIPKKDPDILNKIRKKGIDEELLGKAFAVFIKRRGKFKKIGDGLSREAALDLGAGKVARSLAAQFKVEATGGTVKQKLGTGDFSRIKHTLRDYKIRGGEKIPFNDLRFIEKKKFRLSTGSEVKEIQAAKKRTGFLGNSRGGFI